MQFRTKQREAKNAIVGIDSVSLPCNWIEITKGKLKERESRLLQSKTKEIEDIVNKELFHLNHIQMTFIITEKMISNTIKCLCAKIDEWNGVILSRIKNPVTQYREYFRIGKKWWDQTKKKIFGELFWIKIFKCIERFVDNMLNVCQKYQFIPIILSIIGALFHGSVQYPNTKSTPLINGGTLINSPEMHQYLFNLNASLQIQSYIDDEESSKEIMAKVQSLLDVAIKNAPPIFIPMTKEINMDYEPLNANNYNNNQIMDNKYLTNDPGIGIYDPDSCTQITFVDGVGLCTVSDDIRNHNNNNNFTSYF